MARNFDQSSNDFLDAGNPSALDLTGDEVSLSAWVRKESSGAEMKVLAKWADAGDDFQYLLSISSGDALFAIFDGSTQIAQGTTTLSVGQWHHLAGSYDGSNLRVYLDGVLEDTTANSGNMSSTIASVRIGAGSGGSGTEEPFDGDIGHCAIWDVGLSTNEIQSLSAGISPLKIRRNNLLEYWPLNGQSPDAGVIGGFDMTLNGSIKSEEPPIPNSILAP